MFPDPVASVAVPWRHSHEFSRQVLTERWYPTAQPVQISSPSVVQAAPVAATPLEHVHMFSVAVQVSTPPLSVPEGHEYARVPLAV